MGLHKIKLITDISSYLFLITWKNKNPMGKDMFPRDLFNSSWIY
jgi:hypothetical protein